MPQDLNVKGEGLQAHITNIILNKEGNDKYESANPETNDKTDRGFQVSDK